MDKLSFRLICFGKFEYLQFTAFGRFRFIISNVLPVIFGFLLREQ